MLGKCDLLTEAYSWGEQVDDNLKVIPEYTTATEVI